MDDNMILSGMIHEHVTPLNELNEMGFDGIETSYDSSWEINELREETGIDRTSDRIYMKGHIFKYVNKYPKKSEEDYYLDEDEISDEEDEYPSEYLDYYYINLKNDDDWIIPDPSPGYSMLLSLIGKCRSFITYKDIVRQYKPFLEKMCNNIILSRLSEREKKILKKRLGLVNRKVYSWEDLADEFDVTEERVKQIEMKALRKISFHEREYASIFFCNVNNLGIKAKHLCVDYGAYLEEIIKRDVRLYNSETEINLEELFSKNIIRFKRFSIIGIEIENRTIDKLGLSENVVQRLKMAKIQTVKDLLQLSHDRMMRIRGIGSEAIDEISKFKWKYYYKELVKRYLTYKMPVEDLNYYNSDIYVELHKKGFGTVQELVNHEWDDINNLDSENGYGQGLCDLICQEISAALGFGYYESDCIEEMEKDRNRDLDYKKIFDDKNEILITRTDLPVKTMLYLLQKGCLYVSDWMDYFKYFSPNVLDDKCPSEEIDAFKNLICYSDPVIRVKISKNLYSYLKINEFDTVTKLLVNKEKIPNNLKTEVDEIIDSVVKAKEKLTYSQDDYADSLLDMSLYEIFGGFCNGDVVLSVLSLADLYTLKDLLKLGPVKLLHLEDMNPVRYGKIINMMEKIGISNEIIDKYKEVLLENIDG